MMTVLSQLEAAEVRALLRDVPTARLAVRRTTAARLRRLGLSPEARRTVDTLEVAIAAGAITVDDNAAAARFTRQPPGRVFRVAVGVTGRSVGPEWNAFDQRYQWFGQRPQQVTSGAHLFVLAVDRWKSACVGLYEAISAGAEKLPNSPDPGRWPYALGVRPLAAIPPPEAPRIDGQKGPQSGLPERVFDAAAIDALYDAVASSPAPPGPRTTEQRVQELEAEDLGDDIVAAIQNLGSDARPPAIFERAIELVGWNEEELAARAWYTGSGNQSHVERVLRQALQRELVLTTRVTRAHGSSPYAVAEPTLGQS